MINFTEWLATAGPGDELVYYTGDLFHARQTKAIGPDDELAARTAWQLYERGLVTLAQRRVEPRIRAYLAIRTRKRVEA